MDEITSSAESEKLRGEENITETKDSVSSEVEDSVSPEVEPSVDYPQQCRLSDVDVERIAEAISKAIIDTLKS